MVPKVSRKSCQIILTNLIQKLTQLKIKNQEAKTEETIHLMRDLNMALRCEPIFRYVDYFFTRNFRIRFVKIVWQDFLYELTTIQFILSISVSDKNSKDISMSFEIEVHIIAVKKLKTFCYEKQFTRAFLLMLAKKIMDWTICNINTHTFH